MGFLHRAASIGMVFAFGCGTDKPDDGLLPGWDLPPAPENGMRIVFPPVHGLEAGSNHEICAWTGMKIDSTTDIRQAIGYQLLSGHHVSLYATKTNMPAGTQRECTDEDMANWRFVVGTGGEGTPTMAPGDLVFRMDEGLYIAAQEHFINATDQTIDSQSVLDLIYADPGTTYIPSHSVAIVNTNLDLPPGPQTMDMHCTADRDFKAWYAIPHMHEWGTMYTSSITHAGTMSTMVDHLPWDKSYMFHPPATTWDPATPFLIHAGDDIDVHCEWNNTTSSDLFFGKEMCVYFMQTVDDTGIGNIDCNNGSWGDF